MSRSEEIASFVEQMFPDLDLYSYYQLLEVEPSVGQEVMRAGFYRQAGRLHPDRYATLANQSVRDQLVIIYARVAEAYKVLSDPQKRQAYDAGLQTGRMRYLESEREKKGPQNPEDAVSRPEAKKFLRLALQAMRTGDARGAHMNFKFALSYEPGNAFLQGQLQAADVELKKKTLQSAQETPK